MHSMKPTVQALPVHLENDAVVVFLPTESISNIEARKPQTALTAWLQYNAAHPHGINKELTYVDFPEHFVFDGGRFSFIIN
jgi:hypothetical protein